MNRVSLSLSVNVIRSYLKLILTLLASGACVQAVPAQKYGQDSIVKSILFTESSKIVKVIRGNTLSLLEYIATSDDNPTRVKLTAFERNRKVPRWLFVNEKRLNGIEYTTGSEISLYFDATHLAVGAYYAVVSASAAGYKTCRLDIKLIVLRDPAAFTRLQINFQDSITIPPKGWLKDYGQSLGLRTSSFQGTGYTYGWIKRTDNIPVDLTRNGQKRRLPGDVLLATFIYMQGNDAPGFNGNAIEGKWEIKSANGKYDVTVSVGDGEKIDSRHTINVEGVAVIPGFVPTSAKKFKSNSASVRVVDGYLTVDAAGGFNTKINTIIIKRSLKK